MTSQQTLQSASPLKSARELAGRNGVRFPNESVEYRRARDALLAEEIELRRHIERVAEMRRALPPGGKVPKEYRFESEHGPVTFAQMFGARQTLAVYSMMYGPQRERPCPMCTSVVASWDHKVPDIEQRVAIAVSARSPSPRLQAFKAERGWKHLRLYSDTSGDYTRAYVSADDEDMPAYNVFTRRDGRLRHFWAGELFAIPPDPGQDPRGAPDMDPLWTLFDTTPAGRGRDWYPKRSYP